MLSSVGHAVLLTSIVLAIVGLSALGVILATLAVLWELFLFIQAGMK